MSGEMLATTREEMMREVLTVFFAVPAHDRAKLVWRLSKTTMEAVAGRKLAEHEADGGCLALRPVERDDGAVGLQYEIRV
jgi:hypothetical protein